MSHISPEDEPASHLWDSCADSGETWNRYLQLMSSFKAARWSVVASSTQVLERPSELVEGDELPCLYVLTEDEPPSQYGLNGGVFIVVDPS